MPKPWEIEIYAAPHLGAQGMAAQIGESIRDQIKAEARRAARAENRLRQTLRGDRAIQRRINLAKLRRKVKK